MLRQDNPHRDKDNPMLYRKMPRTGDELSVLGYGCMRFPEQNGRIDERKSRSIS